jgi:hypothetical protein
MRATDMHAPSWCCAAAAIALCLHGCSAQPPAQPARQVEVARCPPALAPVVYATASGQPGWLLGAARGCTWLSARDAAPQVKAGLRYQVIARRGFPRAAKGAQPTPNAAADACPWLQLVALAPPAEYGEWLAVGGAWNLAPVPADAIAPEQRLRQAVGVQLGKHGLDGAPIAITQILRADLARDGVADDVIVATVGSAIDRVEAGQYSLVLLSSQTRSGPVDVLLAGEFHPEARDPDAPDVFRVVDLLDLDGDGTLEILVEVNDAEGWGVQVYDHAGRKTALAERCRDRGPTNASP